MISTRRRRREQSAHTAAVLVSLELEQRKGEVCVPVRGPGSALECGGHSALFLSALVPRGLPHRHPPRRRNVPRSHCTHSAAASPNLTRCLPHPRTLTPLWSRSRFQTASWQRLGQHGRQHVLHVLLHGPVGVWRGLLGALRSPLALLAQTHRSRALSPLAEPPGLSVGPTLTRRTKQPVVPGATPLGRLSWA